MTGGAEPSQNFARTNIGIAEAADGDLSAILGEGGQRSLALLVGKMGAEGVIGGVEFDPVTNTFIRVLDVVTNDAGVIKHYPA